MQEEVHFGEIRRYQRELCEQFHYPIDHQQQFLPLSPFLNLYQYPAELDYHHQIRIPDHFVRVDAFCREEVGSAEFGLPAEFARTIKPGDKLIYLSMGSMGSVDVALMSRLVGVLGRTAHRFVVSRGLRSHEYRLADNMWGEPSVPQTRVLPLVDLVITHGGNNSVTEAFWFAKPMIVLPLFYDQFDNAQRLHETAFGLRLNPYDFQDHQLTDAIDRLLADQALHQRLRTAAQRMRTDNTKRNAVTAIERIVQQQTDKQQQQQTGGDSSN